MNQYVTGTTIKELREKNKITQVQLAEKLGVSDKTVSKWETGCSLPVALPYDFKKFTLHQRIKTTGWLIQNQKFRTMLQSTDDGDFLSIAKG